MLHVLTGGNVAAKLAIWARVRTGWGNSVNYTVMPVTRALMLDNVVSHTTALL